MRNSLFWRILVIALLPLLILFLLAPRSAGAESLSGFIQDHIFLIIIYLIMVVVSAFIVSRIYIQPVEKLSKNLDEPELLLKTFYKTRMLPKELQSLYKNVLSKLDQVKADREAFQSEKALSSSILSNMNDGILVVDHTGSVTLINEAACRIFGVSQNDALGNSLAEGVRNYKMNELFEKTFETHSPQIASFEIAPEKTYIRCIATPLDQNVTGNILFLMQDLTRIQQLEMIRRDFVSNVSHELRTPLTSLKLLTETIEDGLLENPKEAGMFLKRMSAEVDNMTQMVEELLELSKIESGRVPLEKRWVKPDEMVKSACERMILQAERSGLTCHYHCPTNLPSIHVDKPRLERVLMNLLHNAIKFTPPGGEIEISAYQKLNTVVFYVKDSGFGIPPRDLSRIFERFYKSDPSRSERGTGLGLSIAKHLVEAHGGNIWAESDVNKGSTFSFSIPIK